MPRGRLLFVHNGKIVQGLVVFAKRGEAQISKMQHGILAKLPARGQASRMTSFRFQAGASTQAKQFQFEERPDTSTMHQACSHQTA
jgi:hypothetical protein